MRDVRDSVRNYRFKERSIASTQVLDRVCLGPCLLRRGPRFAWRIALEPLVPSCAAPRLPVAEPVYSADAVYDQVRESTVLAVENAKHAVGMA